MGDRGIADKKRDYTSKAELLLFIDKEVVVTQVQVEAEFNLTEEGAKSKLRRLWHRGLIEPLGIGQEGGACWCIRLLCFLSPHYPYYQHHPLCY
jgi:predicted HTH transcriptional regulator